MRPGTIKKAIEFATEAHGEQLRKYTGEPYVTHPIQVAKILNDNAENISQRQVVAAILHDVVEDTDVTLDDIRKVFGPDVETLVFWLTDVSKPEDGNRKLRKELDRKHIAKAPVEAKTIKLADIIDNGSSITEHDSKFAKVFLEEKRLVLEVLKDGDKTLWNIANELV